jgi:2-amino-4-hydroxy-6-hydroxymethyldihydropteridine diphosphokinase
VTERVRAYVGLGANLGQPAQMLARACLALAALPGTALVRVSARYDTGPIGPLQPRFQNAVAALDTALPARALMDALKALERTLGREPGERWGPRLIDLDLLLHGDAVADEPGFHVPHLRLHERAFVLAPLCELWPDGVHPRLGVRFDALRAALGPQDVRVDGPLELPPGAG